MKMKVENTTQGSICPAKIGARKAISLSIDTPQLGFAACCLGSPVRLAPRRWGYAHRTTLDLGRGAWHGLA
jgi:hypothetical protein